jgi:hypothetical protein
MIHSKIGSRHFFLLRRNKITYIFIWEHTYYVLLTTCSGVIMNKLSLIVHKTYFYVLIVLVWMVNLATPYINHYIFIQRQCCSIPFVLLFIRWTFYYSYFSRLSLALDLIGSIQTFATCYQHLRLTPSLLDTERS